MFPAACAVGVGLAGMPLRDVVSGFPISIMVLLAGVTYFFGIAQANGTIDRVIEGVHAASDGVVDEASFGALAISSSINSSMSGLGT